LSPGSGGSGVRNAAIRNAPLDKTWFQNPYK
jgi:hypothetical protein